MTNAQEKRVHRIAELKGFRLEKGGHGKGHGRFYILNLTEVQRMRSGVLDHEYFFSLDVAESWLAQREAMVPCADEIVRRWRDISIGEKL